jgi:hypothetical protein
MLSILGREYQEWVQIRQPGLGRIVGGTQGLERELGRTHQDWDEGKSGLGGNIST